MACTLRFSTHAAAGASQRRSAGGPAARRRCLSVVVAGDDAQQLQRHTLCRRRRSPVLAASSALPSAMSHSSVSSPELARLVELVSSGGPEALRAAEKAAVKAAKKAAKERRIAAAVSPANLARKLESSSSFSSSSSSSSELGSEDEEGENGEKQKIDVATLAVSLSRLGKRRQRRAALATKSPASATTATATTTSAASTSFDPDAAALTVMHTLSGSVALPSLSVPPSIDGDEEDQIAPPRPPPAFAVCVGPNCSRRGSQKVAAELALAELRQDSRAPRTVVRCGCLGDCGGSKGRLAKGAIAGKVEVEGVEGQAAANLLARSLARTSALKFSSGKKNSCPR